MDKEAYERAIQEFLAAGNEIQQIPMGQGSQTARYSAWGNSKAKENPKDITDINIELS